MEKLRTVRGVHDLLPKNIKHQQVINAGLKISDKYNYSQVETDIEFAGVFLNTWKFK